MAADQGHAATRLGGTPSAAASLPDSVPGPDGSRTQMPRSPVAMRPDSFASGLVLVAALAVLWACSRYSYLLFHSLAELVAISIAVGVFLIAWNARSVIETPYLLFLGVAYLAIALVDVLHALAYKGMGVFTDTAADLPTELWIVGRYLQGAALLMAPFAIGRRPRPALWLVLWTLAAAGLTASSFAGVFPHCFVPGEGLTPFKKVSEYVIAGLMLGSAGVLLGKRRAFDPRVLRLLVASAVVAAVAELAFTLYTDVYGQANLVGHLLRIVSFYLVYKAIIETGLRQPYRLLFRDLKAHEQELAHAHDRLAADTVELTAANDGLKAFAYSVSHDLRAPLRAIDGFARLLEEDCGKELGETGSEHLERIRAAVERMDTLIDDMLRLSQVMQEELHLEQVDLAAMAREIEAGLREREPHRQVELVCPRRLPGVGDPGLLRALLENLIGNAWKFTAPRPLARIELGLEDGGAEPLYFVRDNGVGFDPEHAGRLFVPFSRLHGADEFPGSGIGLATVRRIVSRHGGRVTASAEPGRGATFGFTLPLRPPGPDRGGG